MRLLPFFALLLVAACGDGDYRPNATGQERQVYALVDSVTWRGSVGEALRAAIEQPVRTLPAPEKGFEAVPAAITSGARLEEVKRYKNIVIAAPLSDTTVEARIIKGYFSADAQAQLLREGRGALVQRPNVWRKQQQVVFITAPTDSLLAALIRERGSDLRFLFNEAVRRRTEVDMFERGRQEEKEKAMMDSLGFAVNVQHDYFVAEDTTGFLWLRRVLSDTWRSFFVYYKDDFPTSRLDSAYVTGLRDSLTAQYVTGTSGGYVQIDRRLPLEVREREFLGRRAWETRGVWVMLRPVEGRSPVPTMAGPFVNYTFYDPASRRLYMLDGMVFSPGPRYSKIDFLRQLEVIAHTFRTREDLAARNDAPAQ